MIIQGHPCCNKPTIFHTYSNCMCAAHVLGVKRTEYENLKKEIQEGLGVYGNIGLATIKGCHNDTYCRAYIGVKYRLVFNGPDTPKLGSKLIMAYHIGKKYGHFMRGFEPGCDDLTLFPEPLPHWVPFIKNYIVQLETLGLPIPDYCRAWGFVK
jgi:hypothetical protein